MNIKAKITPVALAIALAAGFGLPAAVQASGGGSGPAVTYVAPGQIGEIVVNPYKIAPLTAVIKNGGYQLKDATVRVVPKQGGQEISYKVTDTLLRTHAGIPVFGLYPDYNNTVEVSYTIVDQGQERRVEKEQYRIYAPAVYTPVNGSMAQHHNMFETEVVKVDPEFKDRLYLINNFLSTAPKQARVVWNNPTGGALEWNYYPQNAIIDTTGEVRWYMFVDPIYDPETIYHSGIMMGFHMNQDGFLTFGYGQRYAKYDLMGREVFNRRLPTGYADFSHALDPAQNGHLFLRVSSSDYRRPDGKRVHTVRDVIAEVDQNGNVVDDFRLFEILDPYRDVVITTLLRPARRFRLKNSPPWTRMIRSATSPALVLAATGHTSTPSTMTRPMIPSSSRRAISPPSSRSAATRRSSGFSPPRRAGRKISPIRCSRLLIRTASL